MALDAVLFDIDGTLIDTNWAHVEAWQRAFEAHGFRTSPERIFREVGKGADQLVPSILGEHAAETLGEPLGRRQREEFLRIARAERFDLFPCATDLMVKVRERGLRVALATSSDADHLEATLESAGVDLRRYADVVVTRDEAGASKPAPDLIVSTVRKLGLSPAQCAMVGDSPYDALACRRAGVVCLSVLSGGNDRATLLGSGARGVWPDTERLVARLDAVLALASPGSAHLGWDLMERLLQEARAMARVGLEQGEMPIGSVVARGDGTVVAWGHHAVRKAGDRTAHAEVTSLRRASGILSAAARDLILVSTLEPCVMCLGAAMLAGVDTVVYGLRGPDGASERVLPAASGFPLPRIVGPVAREAEWEMRVEAALVHSGSGPARHTFP